MSSQPPVALEVVDSILGNIQNSLTEVSIETGRDSRDYIVQLKWFARFVSEWYVFASREDW